MNKLICCALLSLGCLATPVALQADDNIATTRNYSLATDPEPPRMPNVINNDQKQARSYPMQPPTIPHKIDNYQVDINTNKCLSCHKRSRTGESQAPMVSVTHFMDRDGNFLAEISPRRYFCEQCHVVQTDAKVLVDSDFVDMYELIEKGR
ncbi:nitrate reductase cytochrome c-type subunit [Simiduia agarivorans]|uniref:Periplasmic nitrate reductase, electron transfer subunit n=1 Tax=Simiduia agarivorans (strain DSM 21679 / JCM 13881 / BCRC 17597 / SA1) TaxID=1117647 RepID=K4KJY5_SIMAS|nr:nitrate reductase cytochrome c-type subunit [Simiduia agarivorans]AFU98333.1 nitrate reductase cytochrome c-type subunit (NapB) [Simiduia agarivorans SA1 = DSM 21679]